MHVTSMARLVDGKMIAKELGIEPGEWVGRALDVCLSWQLRNPGITNPVGAIQEVRQRSKELQIPLKKQQKSGTPVGAKSPSIEVKRTFVGCRAPLATNTILRPPTLPGLGLGRHLKDLSHYPGIKPRHNRPNQGIRGTNRGHMRAHDQAKGYSYKILSPYQLRDILVLQLEYRMIFNQIISLYLFY